MYVYAAHLALSPVTTPVKIIYGMENIIFFVEPPIAKEPVNLLH